MHADVLINRAIGINCDVDNKRGYLWVMQFGVSFYEAAEIQRKYFLRANASMYPTQNSLTDIYKNR